MNRRFFFTLLRVLVSVGLLVWVLTQTGFNPAELAGAVRDPGWAMLSVAYGLSLLGIVIRAFRWKWLMEAVGARLPTGRAIYLYFVGAFFNAFLPTGFGGDVVRVLEAGQGISSQQAAGTVLVDRLSGFMALFGMALVLLPFSRGLLPPGIAGLIAAMSLVVAAGSALLFDGRLIRWTLGKMPRGSLGGSGSWLSRGYEAALDWVHRTHEVVASVGAKGVGVAVAVSVAFNLVQVLANAAIARALHIDVALAHFVLFIPVASTALLVPSVGGFGVRESFYVALFGQVGVSAAHAVTLSIAAFSLDFAMGLLGGGAYSLASLLGLRRVSRAGVD